MVEIAFGVASFTTIILLLVLFVLGARRVLVPSGRCDVTINGRKHQTAVVGQRLLEVFLQAGVNLPSACGGAGTCGLCKTRVISGGDEPGAQELAFLTRVEAANYYRLACQVPVLSAMSVEVDEASFGVRTWLSRVESTHNVSTLIREIVLRLPEGEDIDFRAGGFVQVTCPPFHGRFADFDIGIRYRDVWDKLDLWRLQVETGEPVTRAYSMANHPAEQGRIDLNVRIALPPPDKPGVPPGLVSTWLFSLKPGDQVEVMGPYGHFFVQDTDRETVFIGGGAGMAPLRSQILDLLEKRNSKRKMSFWYGARSRRELFYDELFDRLAAEYDNFDWHVALSDPQPEDDWRGFTGFIHQVMRDHYMAQHPAPEDSEYYICGPPLMVKAVLITLDDFGVEQENIFYDDFGG